MKKFDELNKIIDSYTDDVNLTPLGPLNIKKNLEPLKKYIKTSPINAKSFNIALFLI